MWIAEIKLIQLKKYRSTFSDSIISLTETQYKQMVKLYLKFFATQYSPEQRGVIYFKNQMISDSLNIQSLKISFQEFLMSNTENVEDVFVFPMEIPVARHQETAASTENYIHIMKRLSMYTEDIDHIRLETND